MELFFFLSNANTEQGQQLLRSIVLSCHRQHVIVLVKEFEQLSRLFEDYPTVTWIAVDINRQNFLASLTKLLPLPNYVVNLSGQHFADVTLPVLRARECTYKERERDRMELTFGGIVNEDDGVECKIFVNIVEKRSDFRRKSKTFTKTVGKLVKGAKKTLSNLTQDDDDAFDENEPLINRTPYVEEPPPQSFLSSLWLVCCSCFFTSAPDVEHYFQTPQELRLLIKSEHLLELHNSMRALQEISLIRWAATQVDLRKKESQKLEELVSRIDDLRDQEEEELVSLKDKQNRNTRENLSGVLSQDILKKIEASRARQTKGRVQYDADRAFREGQTLISKQAEIDLAQLRERHYSKLMEEQLRKLTELSSKYQKKEQTLHARHFGSRA